MGCWGERRRLRRYLTMFSPASVNVMPPADGKRVGVAKFYNVEGDVAWRAYAVDPSLNRFDPQRGADHARAYATKYASKPETGVGRNWSPYLLAAPCLGRTPSLCRKWYVLEVTKNGLKDWLKSRTVGNGIANSRLGTGPGVKPRSFSTPFGSQSARGLPRWGCVWCSIASSTFTWCGVLVHASLRRRRVHPLGTGALCSSALTGQIRARDGRGVYSEAPCPVIWLHVPSSRASSARRNSAIFGIRATCSEFPTVDGLERTVPTCATVLSCVLPTGLSRPSLLLELYAGDCFCFSCPCSSMS